MPSRYLTTSQRLTAAVAVVSILVLTSPLAAQLGLTVLGKVEDEDGNPVAGATVTIEGRGIDTKHRMNVTTNAKGKYSTVFIHPARDFIFLVRKEGFVPHEELLELGLDRANLRKAVRRNFVIKAVAADPAPKPKKKKKKEKKQDEHYYEFKGTETEPAVKPKGGKSAAVSRYQRAVKEISAYEFETARTLLEEALAADPMLAPAHSALAKVHLNLKQYAAAAAAAEKALNLDGRDARALTAHYRACSALGRGDDAQRSLDKLADQDPARETVELLLDDGMAALKSQHWTRAEKRYRQALGQGGDPGKAGAGLARALLGQGSFAAALEEAERLLDDDRRNHTALVVRYQAYQGLGDAEKVVQAESDLQAGERAQ